MSALPFSSNDATLAASLFTGHQGWLLQRLLLRLRNRAEAEDVASETFLRVLHAGRLSAIREPRAYLTTVAKSVLLQQWRRRDIEQAYLESLALLPESVQPSPEERVVLLEALERLSRALDTLSAKARSAFLMSQLDGLTYAQIAAQLGVSASMVRQYMAQGLRCCLAAADPA
ncbi:putative RNA polymerase sigma factor FecI [Janthinobacterium sp. KBS0711]|uniref:sigma-70 family RNA polymerase sigma factor n=1 Tax=Janthinobacterium sp. KBS0711 TaxID=1649647 RepID=UPI00062778E8|nr:sigma-70 family RNA polymerase sigma factor [Janthinobacterium sp. KBS0711]KKO61936.1 putative RNA polymerase sigma factor FecI [Janthinobacterium sp. KBS0711]